MGNAVPELLAGTVILHFVGFKTWDSGTNTCHCSLQLASGQTFCAPSRQEQCAVSTSCLPPFANGMIIHLEDAH